MWSTFSYYSFKRRQKTYKRSDVVKICKNKKIITNLEISLNEKIINIALKNKPNFICIVPEKRKEVTTEGGLNLIKIKKK